MIALSSDALTAWGAVLLALLGGGGIYGIFRVRPEAAQISVSAAQGAVIVQTGVIDSLREENKRLADRLSELERTSANVTQLQERVEFLESDRTRLRREAEQLRGENTGLRDRVQTLESEVASLRGPVTDEHGDMVDRRDVAPPGTTG